MTDIQQARDVLAKWRQLAYDTAWEVDTNHPFSSDLVGLFIEADHEYAVKFDPDELPHISTARLIVGTAGNPDLLDAIDSLLATAQREDLRALGLGPLLYDAERTAETIIAADDRMRA